MGSVSDIRIDVGDLLVNLLGCTSTKSQKK